MATFGERVYRWLCSLRLSEPLPDGVELLNPYATPEVRRVVRLFTQKFYADSNRRIGIFGINPGRFGAGVTGVIFTDPVALRQWCGIPNQLGTRRELSSRFVYMAIDAFGGVEQFYQRFYLSALSPLGFVRSGRNLNFYDLPQLERRVLPFIVESLRRQLRFPLHAEVAIVLGSGKLAQIAERLNQQHRFFERLIVVEHPRYIMQYRRRQLRDYIERYVRAFNEALSHVGANGR